MCYFVVVSSLLTFDFRRELFVKILERLSDCLGPNVLHKESPSVRGPTETHKKTTIMRICKRSKW